MHPLCGILIPVISDYFCFPAIIQLHTEEVNGCGDSSQYYCNLEKTALEQLILSALHFDKTINLTWPIKTLTENSYFVNFARFWHQFQTFCCRYNLDTATLSSFKQIAKPNNVGFRLNKPRLLVTLPTQDESALPVWVRRALTENIISVWFENQSTWHLNLFGCITTPKIIFKTST